MKPYLIALLLLCLMASVAFAVNREAIRSECQQSCCDQFDGSYSNGQCTGATSSTSVSSCVSTCEQIASGGGCCASAALLLMIPAMLFIRNRKS